MKTEPNRYHAFLLRLWPDNAATPAAACWRATLEDARTGERLGFASLEQLFAHLMQLAEARDKAPSDQDPPPAAAAE